MLYYQRLIVCFFCLFFLLGCQEQSTYHYYLSHPQELIQAAENCQHTLNKSRHCDVVLQAAQDLMINIKKQQEDPEAFGEKILQAQMLQARTTNEIKQTKAMLAFAQDNQGAMDIKAVAEKLSALKQECQKQHQQIQTLLSVIALGRPE